MNIQAVMARLLRAGSPAVGDLKIGPRPIDLSRPRIDNGDGSFSTERTATFDAGGQQVLLPTIVNGAQLEPRAAYDAWLRGANPEVGAFKTPGDAERYAKARTLEIGMRRK